MKYLLKKTIQLVIAMLILSILVFFVARLAPGEPLRAFYGEGVERMSTEAQEVARERLGLNESLITQYVNWLEEAISGDFGISYKYKQDAITVIEKVMANTMLLVGISFVLIFLLGLFLAIFCVSHEGSRIDRIICRIGVATNSVPEFFLALLLVLIFSVNLGWLPSSGAYSLGGGGILDRFWHLILPVSAIVIAHLWYCAYLMRNKLSEEMDKEYVLLCRVKGLSEGQIIYTHCLRNIMPSVISIMAIFLPHLLGGAYVIEMVFSYQGIGTLGFESAKYHDYNMLMLVCIITGAIVIICNMVAQGINEILDPRMKAKEEGVIRESI